ncbi:MAG: RNA replicase [Circular genetic element sp.]|nr:MAG: RNA replicase [Circular genetic element sp.]
MQVFFNPDMKYFVTLTYKGATHKIDDVMYDMKIWLKHERRNHENLKYIWVAEYQARGSIHVHMITNANFSMRKNKNGYDEITYWADKIGFTSVLHITNFDRNFKPYLYLFKYMRKAQRIGKSFLHTSRNINNFEKTDTPLKIENYSVVNQERTQHTYPNNPDKTLTFLRYYLIHDNVEERTKYIKQLRESQKWKNLLLQSTRVQEKKAENHIQH